MYYGIEGIEKRKHKRIEKQYTTKFRVRSDETRDMGSDDWYPVILRNLSSGGALFFLSHLFYYSQHVWIWNSFITTIRAFYHCTAFYGNTTFTDLLYINKTEVKVTKRTIHCLLDRIKRLQTRSKRYYCLFSSLNYQSSVFEKKGALKIANSSDLTPLLLYRISLLQR
jgi:hypothetical protein